MDTPTTCEKLGDQIPQIVARLAKTTDPGENWEACVSMARDLGADALNILAFQTGSPAPLWFRVSTHERGGLEEYIAKNFMSVDPILVSWADGSMKDVDHISLHRNLKEKTLSDHALHCYERLFAHGQSDYITFRIRSEGGAKEEKLVVFACSAEVAEFFKDQIEQLGIIANLFALYTVPPTPGQAEGKVPLLYEFLTKRERDVLNCLARGMQNVQAAHHLGVTEATIRMHTTAARKKMQATTRSQAIALALKRGLISL